MKKSLFIISFVYLFGNCYSQVKHNIRPTNEADTFTVKNILSSVSLYYGMELGEKRQADMLDTLLHETPFTDSLKQFNLIILQVKQLGIKNKQHIFFEDIIDSAKRQGYKACAPQVGAEILVHTQNMPHDKSLFTSKVVDGMDVFIGMDPETHSKIKYKKGEARTGKFFDYVFCIKSDPKKKDLALGYTKSDSNNASEVYVWTSNDYVVLVNKNH